MDQTLPKAALADDHNRVTPMMAQYIEIKAANPDCLLFYRMGDFYELFFADAEAASRTLGIVLTRRGKHGGADIPMCGVPVERANDYLQRLIAAGFRVAVCEQTEDPAEARKRGPKSVVRRDVIRLVTPGTVTEESLLEPGRPSLLVAITRIRAGENAWHYGIAAVDISTGRFTVLASEDATLAADIARLEPREILVPDAIHDDPALRSLWQEGRSAVTPVARDGFDAGSAEKRLAEYFGVSLLDGFGTFSRPELSAAAGVLNYVERTQLGVRVPLSPPLREVRGSLMQIDAATRANLELTRRLSGERTGSLLSVMDATMTPAGGRLMAERLAGPLTVPDDINARLDAVSFFREDAALRDTLRANLKKVPDIARALARLALERGGPRDLAAIRDGMMAAGETATLLAQGDLPKEVEGAVRALRGVDAALADTLALALRDDLPLHKRDGGFVRAGYLPLLDDTLVLKDDSRRVIAALQGRYASETECRTLRVKHNNFLGYFIEVPQIIGEKLLREPFSTTFIHRQTMADQMRFSTAELGALESRLVSAADHALALELDVFSRLNSAVLAQADALKRVADALAIIDVSAALADLAERRGWVRPEITEELDFHVTGGRHPVVEAVLSGEGKSFVANDCDLSAPEGQSAERRAGKIFLVTGPNMAGKSTFLRQNALIAVLAQMGAHVPANAARLGIVDRLFSRVGAADDLARGRSTFMVEMVETAAILNQATARSLVILDEIGRGTATFDGLSIAWAAVEHLHEVNHCRALFATHFHELTALTKRLERLSNVTMRVTDWQGDVVFLHEVIAGAADRSYGIQVAKLAGLPASVLERARHILAELERSERQAPVQRMVDDLPLFASLAARAPEPKNDTLRLSLSALHPDDMSPKEALEALYRLKTMV